MLTTSIDARLDFTTPTQIHQVPCGRGAWFPDYRCVWNRVSTRYVHKEPGGMKHPYIPIYIGDWKKDTSVSLCSLATRGAWIELIFSMHEKQVGSITATVNQFALLVRCSTEEMTAILRQLRETGTADITDNVDGSKTIACRRLKRKEAISKLRMVSGSKGGTKTVANREQTPVNDNDNEDKALKKVRTFCKDQHIIQSDADWFFWKCQSNGWTNGGRPILDWKATLRSWQRAHYLPSQKRADRYSKDPQIPPSPTQPSSNNGPPKFRPLPEPPELSDEEFERIRDTARKATEDFRKKIHKL